MSMGFSFVQGTQAGHGKQHLITNFEVLQEFRQVASKLRKPKRGKKMKNTFEHNVLNYLEETPASVQTQESLQATFKALAQFNLTKAETLQILNLRPSSLVEIFMIVEECEERLDDNQTQQLLHIIDTHLPALPDKMTTEEGEGDATGEAQAAEDGAEDEAGAEDGDEELERVAALSDGVSEEGELTGETKPQRAPAPGGEADDE